MGVFWILQTSLLVQLFLFCLLEREWGSKDLTVNRTPWVRQGTWCCDCVFAVALPHTFFVAGTKTSMSRLFLGNYSGVLAFSLLWTHARTHRLLLWILCGFTSPPKPAFLCHLVKWCSYLSCPLTSLVSLRVTITKWQWPTQNPGSYPPPSSTQSDTSLRMGFPCPRRTWLYI